MGSRMDDERCVYVCFEGRMCIYLHECVDMVLLSARGTKRYHRTSITQGSCVAGLPTDTRRRAWKAESL